MKQKTLLTAVLCLQLIALNGYAQNLSEERAQRNKQNSMRVQALSESTVAEKDLKKSKISSDAQLEGGMLSLKDPRPEVVTRSWKYFLQLSLQQFHPEGSAQNSIRSNFDLNANSSTLMPAVAFGLAVPSFQNDQILTSLGLALKIGYASQNGRYVYSSGYVEDNIRLNSMLTSVKPYLGLRLPTLSWLEADLGIEYGTLTYMQTSPSDITNFSQAANFGGWNIGLKFDVNPTVAITTEYSQRKTLNSSDSIALQKSNFELGTRITW